MTSVEEVTADAVAIQLRALELMSIAKLRIAWRRLYRAEPPKRATRELLTLAVAWKIQEQAYGGLTAATRRRLAHLATTMERDGDVKRARIPASSPAPSSCANGGARPTPSSSPRTASAGRAGTGNRCR